MSSTEKVFVELMHRIRSRVGDPPTDAELLACFNQRRDEDAFEALVQRYGGLVLGVARRQLHDHQIADDVFQATFLALARSANRLGTDARPLASWLFTVARRHARKARHLEDRRAAHEKSLPAQSYSLRDPLEEISGRELIRIINDEIARLPRDYQLPLLLCCVEGLSREQAAQQLGWTEGAVKGRLERGRRALADRLSKRGITVSATLLVSVAEAHVPTSLLARTAAMATAPWSGSIPAPVLHLVTHGASKVVLAGLAIVLMLSVGLAAYVIGPQVKKSSLSFDKPTEAQAGPKAKTVEIVGKVMDENDKPAAGAAVEAIGTAWIRRKVTTSAEGRFKVQLPETAAQSVMLIARFRDGKLQAHRNLPITQTPNAKQSVTLTLRPARKLNVRVVDKNKRAVARAWVAAIADHYVIGESKTDAAGKVVLLVPARAPLQHTLASKPDAGLDYVVYRGAGAPPENARQLPPDHSQPLTLTLNGTRTVKVRVVDGAGKPMKGIPVYPSYVEIPDKGGRLPVGVASRFHSVTNANGVATFDELPADNNRRITFWPWTHEKYHSPQRAVFDPKSEDNLVQVTLLPLVPVAGRVTFADGSPTRELLVQVSGSGHLPDRFRGSARTKADGAFEIRVYPDQYYQFVVHGKKWASPSVTAIILRAAPKGGVTLIVQPATRIFGRVTVGAARIPVVGHAIGLAQRPAPVYYELPLDRQLPNPTNRRETIQPLIWHHVNTDKDGRFEFFVGPGSYYVIGPDNVKPPEFEITDQKSHEVNLHAALSAYGPLAGRVVRKKSPDHGVAKANVTSVSLNPNMRRFKVETKADGSFATERGLCDALIHARSRDGKLAGIVKIKAEDKRVVVPIVATATARGRLIDGFLGKPVPNTRIDYAVQVTHEGGTSSRHFGGSVTTDANGEFTVTSLIPGWEYLLWAAWGTDPEGLPRSWIPIGKTAPKNADPIKLGDLQLRPPPRWRKPPEPFE